MDEFKMVIVVAILVSLATLGTIIYVSQVTVGNSSIPDVERGMVVSKKVITDNPFANFSVTLLDNKVLYIQNNGVLYDSILENQTIVFDCRIDFKNRMLLIESVNPQSGLVISKAQVTDKSPANYGVNLANGRNLYIVNNSTLYDSIAINQTYLFDCRMDYNNNILILNQAQLVTNSNK
jgi:hypothetical protein